MLRENLKMKTSLGMRWETLHVVIDSRPEEVHKEVFTFAVYSNEQGMYLLLAPPILFATQLRVCNAELTGWFRSVRGDSYDCASVYRQLN